MKKIIIILLIILTCMLLFGCTPAPPAADSPQWITKAFFQDLKQKKFDEAYYLVHSDCRQQIPLNIFKMDMQAKHFHLFDPITKIITNPPFMLDTFTHLGINYQNIAQVETQLILSTKKEPVKFFSHLASDENGKWRMLIQKPKLLNDLQKIVK